jgi:hypothetical protein
MKIFSNLAVLMFLVPFSVLSQVFDYSKFTDGVSKPENIQSNFIIRNFDACWNLEFKSGDDSRPKVLLGTELSVLILKKDTAATAISYDDKSKSLISEFGKVGNEITLGSVTFTTRRTDDVTCDEFNKEIGALTKAINKSLSPKKTESNFKIPSERNPFFDAILLQQKLQENKLDEVASLLSLYGITKENISSSEILSKYSTVLTPSNTNKTFVLDATVSSTAGTQGGESVSFVANLTEALAQFIAKRAKEELTLAYLNRFREFLQQQNTKAKIGVLLPKSFRVLNEVEPYDYTTFWQAMHEGFQDDVSLFPENTMSFVRANEPQFKDKDLFSGTVVGLYTLRGVYRQYSAVDVIDSLELLPEIKNFKTSNVGATLRTLSLLSRNLHHLKEVSGQYKVDGWIRPNELVALSNSQTRDFFAGLLIAKENELMTKILFKGANGSSVSLKKVFISSYQNEKFRDKLDGLLRQLEVVFKSEKEVAQYLANMKEDKDKTRTTFERYETYANQLLTLMDFSTDIVKTMNPSNSEIIGISKAVSQFSAIGHTGVDLTKHMYEKRYNLAFFDVLKLMKDLNIPDTSNTNSEFWGDFVRYGTFITNVAGADSASQIVAALETAALPVGSYRIKHENHFSVSLNAFGGLSGSHEFLSRIRPTNGGTVDPKKQGFVLNPTAPIGLHFGWGRKGKIFETVGFFIPVIDIGAAFALRFRGDVQALPDKLEWDNILAPGLYFVTGFKNSPIALSFGVQYGAGLRKLEYNADLASTSFSAQSVWVGATLSVDIPLFNLHVSKGRKVNKSLNNAK